MATIKNGLLGDARGSHGNNYFRMQNGKLVICAKPSKYRASQKPRPKAIRNMMSNLMQVSKALMQDKFFYDLWKIKEIKGLGPYHKFVVKNHFGKNNTQSLEELKLSPYDDAFNAELQSCSITNTDISVTVMPLGSEPGINTFREPLIMSKGIIIGSGLKGSSKNSLYIEPLETKPVSFDLNTPLTFTFKFPKKAMWSMYPDYTVLLILATLNSEEKPVRTSVTLTGHVST